MKNYAEKFEQVKTLKELFDFRKELMEDAESFSNYGNDMEKLKKCQEANKFSGFVEARIDYLIAHGYSLDTIQEPPPQLSQPQTN